MSFLKLSTNMVNWKDSLLIPSKVNTGTIIKLKLEGESQSIKITMINHEKFSDAAAERKRRNRKSGSFRICA